MREIDSFCDTMADLGLFKLMKKCNELYSIRPRNKKKKVFTRSGSDALSDTSDSDNPNKGRMLRRSKVDFKSIMDKGWTSAVQGGEVHDPSSGTGISEEGTDVTGQGPEEPDEPEEETDFIYYYDPVTEKVGKIGRRKCMSENLIIRRDEDGKEQQDGAVEEWEGDEGKSKLIWKFKEALKGHKQKQGAQSK
jgi:hypothetical protein